MAPDADQEVHQADIDAAWRDEFRRRLDELETGSVQPVPHEETVAQARALLAART